MLRTSLPQQDVATFFFAASFVMGPVSENAEKVDFGWYTAVMSEAINQIAFKDCTLLDEAIKQGKVGSNKLARQRPLQGIRTTTTLINEGIIGGSFVYPF